MLKKAGIFLLFIVLLLAAAGGVYYFYQHKAKQFISSLVEQFSPVAKIQFAGFEIDLDGNIQLLHVQVAPVGYQDVVLIDKIDLETGSALTVFSADTWFKGTLPESLKFQFTSMIFGLDADFLRAKNLSRIEQLEEHTIWGIACAKESNFITLANKLGLMRLQVDAQVNIESDASNKVLRTSIAMSAPGLAKGLFEFELNSMVPLNFYERTVLSQSKISHALLSVTDVGLNLKRLKYCAKNETISEANYPEYFKASVQLKMLGETTVNQPELDQSILAFFKPRANVVMRLIPKEPLYLPDVFGVHFDALENKDLLLTVNNKKASTLYLPLLKGQNNKVFKHVEEEKEQVMLADIKEKVVKKVNHTPRFRKVEVEELVGLEGKKIRLKTQLGKELDGVLLEINSHKIVMQRRVEQGVVTYPIQRKNIATVKVFR